MQRVSLTMLEGGTPEEACRAFIDTIAKQDYRFLTFDVTNTETKEHSIEIIALDPNEEYPRTYGIPVYKTEASDGLKAEGLCDGLPFNTELANSNGVSVLFWIGDRSPDDALKAAEKATRTIRGIRDVVYVYYAPGEPSAYWANERYGSSRTAANAETSR